MLTHEPHLQIIKSSLLFRILLIWLCLAKKAPPICFSNRRFMWSNQTEESWLKGRAGPKAARFREWIQWGRCTEVQRKINESGLTGWLPSMLYFVFLHFKSLLARAANVQVICVFTPVTDGCYFWNCARLLISTIIWMQRRCCVLLLWVNKRSTVKWDKQHE